MDVTQAETGNALLKMLSPEAFSKFSRHLQPIVLSRDLKLSKPNTAFSSVVFPTSGIVSVIETAVGTWQEVGLFGKDGATGIPGILSQQRSFNLEIVQVPGFGHEIDIELFRSAFAADAEIREVMLKYVRAFIVQFSMTAVSNAQCTINQRLARWLMMIQDRMQSDQLALTHEYIAIMLGVARSSVTISLLTLERAGMISTGRKLVQILDRTKLRALCGKYYGPAEQEYDNIMAVRLLAGPAKDYAARP